MIRTANLKDIPEIVDLIKSEPGFWDETWRDNVLSERGCKILISDVWKGSAAFYHSIGWPKPDVVLMRKIIT